MDLVFFGSGAFGLPTLKALAQRHSVRAIITQPDRPAGRRGISTPTPVAAWSAECLPHTPVLKPDRINREPGVLARIREIPAEAMVVIAYGQKLGPSLLEGRFAINLHGSLLPRWRGAAPINAALLAGDREVGNSVITLADRMDAGLILAQSSRTLPDDPPLNAGEVHDLLAADGPPLVLSVLDVFAAGTLTPRAQDESLVTLAPKLSRADDWIDFARGAEDCRRRILGLSPWPGITVLFRGQPLKLLRATIAESDESNAPGTIVDPDRGTVSCSAGRALRLLDVHPAGKRPMSWADFARGQRIQAGERLSGRTDGGRHA